MIKNGTLKFFILLIGTKDLFGEKRFIKENLKHEQILKTIF